MNFKVVFFLSIAVVGCTFAVPLDEKLSSPTGVGKNESLPLPAAGGKLSSPTGVGKNDSLPLPAASGSGDKKGRAINDMNMSMNMMNGMKRMNNMDMGMSGMGMRSRRSTPELPKNDTTKNDTSLPTPAPPAAKPKRDAEEPPKADADKDKKPMNGTTTTPAPASSKPKRDAEDEDEQEFQLHHSMRDAEAHAAGDKDKKVEQDPLKKNDTEKAEKKSKRDAEEPPKADADKDKKPMNNGTTTTPAPSSKPKRAAEADKKPAADKDAKPAEHNAKPLNETAPAAGEKNKTEEHKATRSVLISGNNCDPIFGCKQNIQIFSRDAEADKKPAGGAELPKKNETSPAKPAEKDASKDKLAPAPLVRRRRSDYGGSSQVRLAVRNRPVAVRAQKVRTAVVRDDSFAEDEQLVIREAVPARKAVRVVAAAPAVRLSSSYDSADDEVFVEDEPVLIRQVAPVRQAKRARVISAPARSAVRVSSGYDSEILADEQVVVADDDGYGSEVRVAAAPAVRARTRAVVRSSGY